MASRPGLSDPEMHKSGSLDPEFSPAGMLDPDLIVTAAVAGGPTTAQEVPAFVQEASGMMVGTVNQ